MHFANPQRLLLLEICIRYVCGTSAGEVFAPDVGFLANKKAKRMAMVKEKQDIKSKFVRGVYGVRQLLGMQTKIARQKEQKGK